MTFCYSTQKYNQDFRKHLRWKVSATTISSFQSFTIVLKLSDFDVFGVLATPLVTFVKPFRTLFHRTPPVYLLSFNPQSFFSMTQIFPLIKRKICQCFPIFRSLKCKYVIQIRHKIQNLTQLGQTIWQILIKYHGYCLAKYAFRKPLRDL